MKKCSILFPKKDQSENQEIENQKNGLVINKKGKKLLHFVSMSHIIDPIEYVEFRPRNL